MEEIKELSEEDRSINSLFDDEFPGKILRKKGKDFIANLLLEIVKEDDEIKEKIRKELKYSETLKESESSR